MFLSCLHERGSRAGAGSQLEGECYRRAVTGDSMARESDAPRRDETVSCVYCKDRVKRKNLRRHMRRQHRDRVSELDSNSRAASGSHHGVRRRRRKPRSSDNSAIAGVGKPRLCPECGGALLVKTGKFGLFISCARYPECKYSNRPGKIEPKKYGWRRHRNKRTSTKRWGRNRPQ